MSRTYVVYTARKGSPLIDFRPRRIAAGDNRLSILVKERGLEIKHLGRGIYRDASVGVDFLLRPIPNRLRKPATHSARNTNTRDIYDRITNLVPLLKAGNYNANTLAQRFNVNPKTIHRDIVYLRRKQSMPIRFDRARGAFVLETTTGK